MKIFDKKLSEYWFASWKFLLISLIIMIIRVVLDLLGIYPAWVQILVVISGLFVISRASWTAVKIHRFNIKQAGFVGFLFIIVVIWTFPIFHPIAEIFILVIINSVIYAIVATFAGWLAKKFQKNQFLK